MPNSFLKSGLWEITMNNQKQELLDITGQIKANQQI